jgi:hypothetical protein
MLSEILIFLARPTTKPSHRIYCLGLLNKFATMEASSEASIRTSLLSIYFGLFNKLLHQNPEQKVDLEQETKKLKKDRSISKKQRGQLLKKLRRRKTSEVDEEDNKVVELVLKGINIILVKAGDAKDLHTIINEQADLLFKLTHHKVLRIQLQVLKLLF